MKKTFERKTRKDARTIWVFLLCILLVAIGGIASLYVAPVPNEIQTSGVIELLDQTGKIVESADCGENSCVLENYSAILLGSCSENWTVRLIAPNEAPVKFSVSHNQYVEFLATHPGTIYSACPHVQVISDGKRVIGCGNVSNLQFSVNEILSNDEKIVLRNETIVCRNGVLSLEDV